MHSKKRMLKLIRQLFKTRENPKFVGFIYYVACANFFTISQVCKILSVAPFEIVQSKFYNKPVVAAKAKG